MSRHLQFAVEVCCLNSILKSVVKIFIFFYPKTSKLKSVYLGQKTIGGVVPQLWSQVSNFPKTKTYKKRFFFVG